MSGSRQIEEGRYGKHPKWTVDSLVAKVELGQVTEILEVVPLAEAREENRDENTNEGTSEGAEGQRRDWARWDTRAKKREGG